MRTSPTARRRIVALVAMLFLVSTCGGDGPATDGPLTCGPLVENPQAAGWVADVGQPFTFADVVVWNCGDAPLTLDGVRLIRADPRLKEVGAMISPVRGMRYISGNARFPPPFENLAPLAGYEMGPSRHPGTADPIQISIGLEPTAEGSYGFRSVAIAYHVGDRRYEVVVPYAVLVCSPPRRFETRPCETTVPAPPP